MRFKVLADLVTDGCGLTLLLVSKHRQAEACAGWGLSSSLSSAGAHSQKATTSIAGFGDHRISLYLRFRHERQRAMATPSLKSLQFLTRK